MRTWVVPATLLKMSVAPAPEEKSPDPLPRSQGKGGASGGAARNDIQLLKDEGGGLLMEEGITTVTFYTGNFRSSSEAVRAQFAQVVAANPWLAGRLVKEKGGVLVRHPVNTDGMIESLFTATSADDASAAFKHTPRTAYVDICTEMYKSKVVVVGSGYSLLGKDKPLTLLTLAESAPGAFALIFSMSHVVGDGRTYYEILKMLQPGAAVRELPSTRVMTFSESMKDMCGRKELEWVDSASAAFMYTFAMLPLMMGCAKKPRCYAFSLDAERLAAAKAEGAAAGGVPYVTTNDILTSGFFNECNARIGMMGLDCRDRVPGISKDLAGNYVSALVLGPEVFATPATLRKMYASTPYKTTVRPRPGCCCGNKTFAMVTNWSSFAGAIVPLEGCEMVVHLPVKNPAYVLWDLMIPFTSGPQGEKGVIIWTVSADEAGLRQALPVGESVSKELFP